MGLSTDQRERLANMDITAMCDADKALRVLAPEITLRSPAARMVGTAHTVRCDGDFFGALHALETASPGDVLVVAGGGAKVAYAGELFARAAIARGLAGIIVDGGYRDIAWTSTCPLPVYSRYVTPMAGTTKKPGQLGVEVVCGDQPIRPGDVNGIVVLDPGRVDDVIEGALKVEATEARVMAAMAEGATLSDCLNVAEHARRLAVGEDSTLRFLV